MTETTTAPAPAVAPSIPANDSNVKVDELMDRVQLLLATGTSDPTQREVLDRRAFQAAARHFSQKWDNEKLVNHVEELPAYGTAGHESLRYTKQRAELLEAIATANGCSAELTYRKYTYPNPNTGRRQYRLRVWGLETDVQRTLMIFHLLQTRVIKDSYSDKFLPIPEGMKPAQQTQARRSFFSTFAANTASTLDAILAGQAKTKKLLEERLAAAETAEAEWADENATAATPEVAAS